MEFPEIRPKVGQFRGEGDQDEAPHKHGHELEMASAE
jgi:hypothetical protein